MPWSHGAMVTRCQARCDTNLTKSKVFKPFMRRFRSIIQQKWSEAPNKVAELERFLRDKNIEVDVIGTSETDIGVWLDTIENCR